MRKVTIRSKKNQIEVINQFFIENILELHAFADSCTGSDAKSREAVCLVYFNMVNCKTEILNIRAYAFNLLYRMCYIKSHNTDKSAISVDVNENEVYLEISDTEEKDLISNISDSDISKIWMEIRRLLTDVELALFQFQLNGLSPKLISSLTGKSLKSVYTGIDRYKRKLRHVKKFIKGKFFD